jgi:hypothetical protein
MPEPSPLKRLGFFMSKMKSNIEDRNRCKLSQCFPGTVVSVEINTADKQSYALPSELTEADIF